MQWLAELCVKRPVFATVLSLVILVVGSVFYAQLGVDQFPKIDFPVIVVTTVLPGSSPEDIETDITDKVEGGGQHHQRHRRAAQQQLRGRLAGHHSVRAGEERRRRRAGGAAEDQHGAARAAASGVDPPIVQKFDPDAQPVLFIALQATRADVREITDIADRVVRRRLESVNGVGQALLIGGRKRQVHVLVDPVKLKRLGIAPAGGGCRHQRAEHHAARWARRHQPRLLTVRVEGRVASVDELRAIIVRDAVGPLGATR
jgi:HAE1 family hydrophobic/amphiphilic exporter-1